MELVIKILKAKENFEDNHYLRKLENIRKILKRYRIIA